MNAQFFALAFAATLNPKLPALDLLMAVIAVALGAYLTISAPELTARTTA